MFFMPVLKRIILLFAALLLFAGCATVPNGGLPPVEYAK